MAPNQALTLMPNGTPPLRDLTSAMATNAPRYTGDLKAPDASFASIPALRDLTDIAPSTMGGKLPSSTDTALANAQNSLLEAQHRISSPYGSPDNHPGTVGKILHGLSMFGNVAGNIFSPETMALIHGTELNNRVRLQQAKGDVDQAEGTKSTELAQNQQQAQTDYTQQRPEIEQAKIQQKAQIANNKNASLLAQHGFTYSVGEDGTPQIDEDPSSQAYKDRVTLSEMHRATADKDDITAEIAQNHYMPGTPEWSEAQRKLSQVDSRLKVAMAGLGLRRQGLELRKENQAAQNTGIDPRTGQPFAGAAQITGDDGGVTTVGARFAAGAKSSQSAVGAFNDLSGSIDHTKQTLAELFAEGGSLNDPRIISALSDHHTGLAQWVGGLVQGGLTPKQIAATTALRQNYEQAGILRGITKGSASEAGSQRILETVPQAGDSNDVAMSKMDEQLRVRDRLIPGMTGVAGGISVAGKPQSRQAPRPAAGGGGGVQVLTDGGVSYHIPAAMVAEFRKDHPHAR